MQAYTWDQDDVPPATARQILGPGALIGYSTHTQAQFEAARLQPVDYIALGPIFATGRSSIPIRARPR